MARPDRAPAWRSITICILGGPRQSVPRPPLPAPRGGGTGARGGGLTIHAKAALAALLLLSPTAFAGTSGGVAGPTDGPVRVPLALNMTTVEAGPVSAFSIVGRNLTVTWDVSLEANESASNISETAVYWDNNSHGPGPFDRSLYAFVAAGSSVGATAFTAEFGDEAPVGRIYLVLYANVSGADFYNETEWSVEVRAAPALALNTALSDSAILHGASANLTVDAQWPYPDDMAAIRMLWDVVPHGTNGTNASDYPNAEPGQDGPSGNYTFTVTPVNAGNVYFTFAADALGVSYLAPAEHILAVAGEPLVTRDSSPPWVLAGSAVPVSWSVLVEDFINYTTELRYDSVSHPSPRAAPDYPAVAGSFAGTGSGSFQATVPAPAGPAVYFYLVAYVDGRAFSVTDLSGQRLEFAVEVRPLPVLQLVDAPAHAFAGRNVTVEMRVAWGYSDPLAEVAVHYDAASHGATPTLPLPYASTDSVTGVPAGWFNFTMAAMPSPGTFFFAFRVRVGTVDIASLQEHSVRVVAVPTVQVAGPAWVLPAAMFAANVTVEWNESETLDVRIYHDGTSGAPDFDLAHYSGMGSAALSGGGTVPLLVQAPSTPGPLYLFAAVESEGEVFRAAAEAVVEVPGAPVIGAPWLTPARGVALHGQEMSVTWRVNFTEAATVSADFRWDTRSHVSAGGFNFEEYPNATALVTGEAGSPMTALFDAPNESTVIYGIVRAVLQGRNYYTAEEVVIRVIPRPVIELLSFPEVVDTEQAIPIRWRIGFQGEPELIPHTAIHWGLVSRAGLPPTFTNYPGVGGPYRGNATNLFDASLPAQDTPGSVYFIVHAVVNGVDFYLEEEAVEVRLPSGPGGGGFLPGLDAVAAIAAAACVAGALRAARGRGRH